MFISNYYKGLTLLEMTMVLLIISILFAGLLSPLHAQMKAQKYKTTQKRLEMAIDAIIGFAIIHGRLPCPAKATLMTGVEQAGEEALTNDSCDDDFGVLPWVTLSVPELDAWQHRFSYRVTAKFADTIAETSCDNQSTTSFALCSTGNLTVNTTMNSGYKLAKQLPAVVVSHGENGDGAYLASGQQLLLVNHDVDEHQNFKKQVNFVDAHLDNANFDDLLAWVSPNILAYRLVQAGVLP